MAAGAFAATVASVIIAPKVCLFTMRCLLHGIPAGAPHELLPVVAWLSVGPAFGMVLGLFGWWATSHLLVRRT